MGIVHKCWTTRVLGGISTRALEKRHKTVPLGRDPNGPPALEGRSRVRGLPPPNLGKEEIDGVVEEM